jgi:hypothetical protein
LQVFAKSFGVIQPDEIVTKIKAGELNVYDVFDRFTGILVARALAKTIHVYIAAVKSYPRHEGIEVDNYQLRVRAGVPPNMETSLDRIPTREEMRGEQLQESVYSLRLNGRQVTNLSYSGVKEAIRRRGRLEVRGK